MSGRKRRHSFGCDRDAGPEVVSLRPSCVGMINYTERIALLMQDVVRRTPSLSFIDLSEVLVFARFGRSDAEGAFATCHCLTLPESEPGYFFWRDRITGELTRRSEWFVTKSPSVRLGETSVKYLISFVLPRFCDQTLERSRKAHLYPGAPGWIAKLDTSCTSSITSIPKRPASAASCARTAPTRCARTARCSTSRSRRWTKAVPRVESRSGDVRLPRDDFDRAERAPRRRAWRRRSGTSRRFRSATWSGWRCRPRTAASGSSRSSR